jgi:hypothetical protein
MRTLLLLFVVLASGCGGRELGWLVPRASVGLVLRSTDTGVSADAYVTLGAPLSGPTPRARRMGDTPERTIHLLGPGPRCRIRPLCRWEDAARTEAFTELAEEQAP